MTVKELIETLGQLDGNQRVMVGSSWDIFRVFECEYSREGQPLEKFVRLISDGDKAE